MASATPSPSNDDYIPPDLYDALRSSSALLRAQFHEQPIPTLQSLYESDIGVYQHYMEQGEIDSLAPLLTDLAQRAAIDGLRKEAIQLTALALLPIIRTHGRDSQVYMTQLSRDISSFARHGHTEIGLLLADELLIHPEQSRPTELLYWYTRTLWMREQQHYFESVECAQKWIQLHDEELQGNPQFSEGLFARVDIHLALLHGLVETGMLSEAYTCYLQTNSHLYSSEHTLPTYAPYWTRCRCELDVLLARMASDSGDISQGIRIIESSLDNFTTKREQDSSDFLLEDTPAVFGKLFVTLAKINWGTDWSLVRKGLESGRAVLNPQVDESFSFDEQSTLVDELVLSYHYLTELTEQLEIVLQYTKERDGDIEYRDVSTALKNTVLGEELLQHAPLPDTNIRALIGIIAKQTHEDLRKLKEHIEIADDHFDKAARLKTALRKRLLALRKSITPSSDPAHNLLVEKEREIREIEETLPSLSLENKN